MFAETLLSFSSFFFLFLVLLLFLIFLLNRRYLLFTGCLIKIGIFQIHCNTPGTAARDLSRNSSAPQFYWLTILCTAKCQRGRQYTLYLNAAVVKVATAVSQMNQAGLKGALDTFRNFSTASRADRPKHIMMESIKMNRD